MAGSREVKVAIIGDASSFNRAFRSASDEADKFSRVQGTVSGTTQKLTGITKSLDDKLAGLGFQSAKTGDFLKAGLGGAAIAAGAAFVKFGSDSVHAFVNLAGEVRDFQRASGASAEESSRFVAVLDDMNISTESGSRAVFKLSRELGTGKDTLKEFGVQVAYNKDGNTDLIGTLLNVADAYKESGSQTERAALVQAAFGRAGKELIPILEQGRDGLRQFFDSAKQDNQIFSQADLDRARQYELAIDNLQDAVGGLQRDIGSALVPTLTSGANTSAQVIRQTDQLTSAVGGLAGVVSFTSDNFGPWSLGLHAASGAMNILSGNFRQGAEDIVRSTGLIGTGVATVGEKLGIFKSGSDDTDKFTESQNRLKDAQSQVTKLSADGTTEATKLRDAKRELAAAESDYEGVVRRVSDALTAQNEKSAQATAEAMTHTGAVLNQQGAQLNVAAATEAYVKTLSDQNATSLDVLNATHNLEVQYVNMGKAAADANAAAGGSAKDQAAAQIHALDAVRDTLAPDSPLRAFLNSYIGDLVNGIPKDVKTAASFEAQEAQARLEDYRRQIANLPASVVTSIYAGIYGNMGAGAEGAIVNAPTFALIGEAGPEALVPLDSMPGNSALPSGIGGGGGIVVNVYGSVLTERELVNVIRDGLINAGFETGTALGAYA